MAGTARERSIELLADHPGVIDRLVRWYERESGSYYGELAQRMGWQEEGPVEFLNAERGKVHIRQLTMGPSP